MTSAVLWQLLQSIQTEIQGLTLVAESGDPIGDIVDEAIVIEKPSQARNENESAYNATITPGIIITPGDAIAPPSAGTNERDDIYYHILIQIIDSDYTHTSDKLPTLLKWQEQIRKALNSQGRSDVMNTEGFVDVGFITKIDTVDDRKWVRDERFVAGVEAEFISREPRT